MPASAFGTADLLHATPDHAMAFPLRAGEGPRRYSPTSIAIAIALSPAAQPLNISLLQQVRYQHN